MSEVLDQLEENPEANQETVSELDLAIQSAFDASVEAESSEDDIKMEMIGAGATFKNVTRLFNQFMIAAGLAISKEDRDAIVADTLVDCDLESEEGFDAAVEALIANVKGATERSAAALVRAYGKKVEVEVYAKPKGTGASRNPFVTDFHTALIANPEMTEQDLLDLIAGLKPEHQVNPTRWLSQHNNIRKTANAIAAKYV